MELCDIFQPIILIMEKYIHKAFLKRINFNIKKVLLLIYC